MYTENELRSALRHSATRADLLVADPPVAASGAVPHRRWKRVVLPAAAATFVAAAATTAVLLGRTSGGHPAANPPASAASSRRTVSSPPAAHVPLDVSGLLDAAQVTVRSRYWAEYDIYNGHEEISQPLTERSEVVVDIVAPGTQGFDPARFPRQQPVPIAGTTGYYAQFKLFPLDADTGPGSDKWVPLWTIAFRTPAGDWAFVHYQDASGPDASQASVDDPAAIAANYDRIGLRFDAGQSRMPLRTGWLPTGVTFDSLMLNTHAGDPTQADLSVVQGSRYLSLDASDARLAPVIGASCPIPADGPITLDAPGRVRADGSPAGHCAKPPQRVRGGFRIQADASGFGRAAQERAVDTAQAAPSATDPGTYWTIAAALG